MEKDLTLNKQGLRTEKVERLSQRRNDKKEIGDLLEASELESRNRQVYTNDELSDNQTEVHVDSPLDLASTADLNTELKNMRTVAVTLKKPVYLWRGSCGNSKKSSYWAGHFTNEWCNKECTSHYAWANYS